MSFLRALTKYFKVVHYCWKHPHTGGTTTHQKYHPDHTFEGKRTLNVGCGSSTYAAKNVVNLDTYEGPGVDVVWDLSKTPLPFKDNEFDFIIANHILEHVPGWWECFKELARVVKVGGIIEVWGPGTGDSQLGYRDHINTINGYSFVGTRGTIRNKANLWEAHQNLNNQYVRDLTTVHSIVRLRSLWWIAIMPNFVQDWMASHLYNVVSEIGFKFRKEPPITH